MDNIGRVPCGTCTACCRNDTIVLQPQDGDIVALYTTVRARRPLTGEMVDVIPLKPDGTCIYLGDKGCTIYDRRPVVCRSFDCRVVARKLAEVTSRADRRRAIREGHPGSEVMREGLKRLVTLVATDEEIRAKPSYFNVVVSEG